jgi:hypothetical protein
MCADLQVVQEGAGGSHTPDHPLARPKMIRQSGTAAAPLANAGFGGLVRGIVA